MKEYRKYLIHSWNISQDTLLTTFSLANVRIFDDYYCRRAYGSVFDPNTEICAGDYNQKTDTMVRKN